MTVSPPITPPVKSVSSDKIQVDLPAWLPLIILAGTIALLFYRLLAGQVLFWGLPALQFQPWRAFAIDELRAGRLPLWNPLNGAGEPLIANYQSAFFYPPQLLGLLIAPGAQGIGLVGMLHLFWAGLGMWLYARQLGLSPFARGIGALAYALNGAVVARFGTVPMVDAAAWLPWLLLTAERLISASTLKTQIHRSIWFALTVALILLTGHAQWTFYSLLLTGLYVLYRLFIAPIGLNRADRWPALIALILGGALGVGMAAVQLVPTAELQAQSQRSGGANEAFVLNFSDEWPVWLTQIDPYFFGNPGDGTYTLKGEYFEVASYVGILPVILALFTIGHVARRWRRWRPVRSPQLGDSRLPVTLVPFFGGIVAIGFLLSLGKNTPLYEFLYQHVPTFNQFQAPARWLFWVVIGLSLLAAIGASLWQPGRIFRQRARLGLIGSLALALIGAIMTISQAGSSSSAILARGVMTIGVLLTCTSIVFLTQPHADRPRATRRWQFGVLIFLSLDLIWANALSNPTVSADFYQPIAAASGSTARTFQPDSAIHNAEFDRFLLTNDYQVAVQRQADYRAANLPNMNMLDHLPTFNVFEPLRIGSIDRYTTLLNTQPIPGLMRAAGIGSTRVWLVSHLIPTADPLAAIADPNWNPAASAFVSADTPLLNSTTSASDSAQITSENSQMLTIATHSGQSAALIVADTWFPGWQTSIDDQPTPILQANGAFRAIVIPAGDHQVVMRYQPRSLQIGAIISGVSLLIILALLTGNRLIRHSSRADTSILPYTNGIL